MNQITITYKMKLYHRHWEELILTKKLYNQVLKFYYEILLEQEELLELSNFLLLRELEILSVSKGLLSEYFFAYASL